jgi:outer membrane lipoprotein-sorting protein
MKFNSCFFCGKRIVCLLISLACTVVMAAQVKSGKELIEKMWKKCNGKVPATISFSQKTIRYVDGKKEPNNSIWYEKIQYPDKFRIDFDSFPSNGRLVCRNDSLFIYKDGKLKRREADKNSLLFLLGGMYSRQLDDVYARFAELKIDLTVLKDTVIPGGLKGPLLKYFLIGKPDGNYLIVEKDNYRIKKIVLKEEEIEAVIMDWQKIGKTWMEKKIDFYRDGKLLQREEYFDIKHNVKFDPKTFDPE